MSVTYTEKAKRLLSEPELAFADATTTEILNEYPYPPVDATWDAGEDSDGRVVLTIQAAESAGTARRVMYPYEVKSKPALRFELYRLCGDLLRERGRRLFEKGPENGEFNGQED